MSSEAARDGADPIVGMLVQGRFKVLSRIAAGGMGVVYRAEQQPLGRVIALKILESKHNPQIDESFSKRFFLEASAAARLSHPNTIVVHDYGKTDEGFYFIAMEYLEGGSLAGRLKKQGPLTPAQAIHVGVQVCGSLREAHAQGLVHRDLKPGNVMFSPRAGDPFFAKVLDFGLVKMVGTDSENMGLTQSGVMMGSPRYMAPEQVKAQPVDHRADIYAFGAMLYHMLSGAPPFAAGSAFEAMHAHVNTPPPPLRSTWPGCPAGPVLESIVMRCLQKQANDRFGSMDEVIYALRSSQNEAGALDFAAVGYSGAGYVPSQAVSLVGHDSSPSNVSKSGMTPSGQRSHASMAAASVPGYEPSRANRTMYIDSAAPPPSASISASVPAAPVPVQPSGGNTALKVIGILFALVLLGGAGFGIVFLVIPNREGPPVNQVSIAARGRDPARVAPELAQPREPAPNTPAPETQVNAQPEAQPAQEAQGVPLMLRTDPPGATVRRDGAELGATPVRLMIPRGQRWTIEILRDGYESRTVTVGGGQPELLVHLERGRGPGPGRRPNAIRQPVGPTPQPLAPQPQPLSPRTTPVVRRPGVYAPDLDDPWANQR
jgi:serine/threonine protein kinase